MRLLVLLFATVCSAQDFSQRGFLESGTFLYPQATSEDSGHLISEALLRYEARYKPVAGLQFSAGIDARADTHQQVERTLHLDWLDRTLRRPAFEVRRLSMSYTRGRLSVEAGKQLIRWGKTDVLNPTDRFAPKDFLNVAETDFMAVTATRVTYGGQSNSLDVIWQPLFTASRMPLLNQRWLPLPPGLRWIDLGARYPGGSNTGVRFNHIGWAEWSLSFYDGHNYFPVIDIQSSQPAIAFQRSYPQMRMFGADAALPLRLFTLKAEAAYFGSNSRKGDEYALYVLQFERQSGEWSFIAGYAGEVVTRRRALLDFAPDRGLARAALARATYTIDPNRSVAVETAVRQNGRGLWLKAEYSQAIGSHWRATAGSTWIRGETADFIGQYRLDSHIYLILRYSF